MSSKDEEIEGLRNLVKELQRQVVEKDEELDDLESNLEQALDSIKNFHSQQQELFESFVNLRDKYDNLKTKNMETLWSWIPKNLNQFRSMPLIRKDAIENEEQIDRYELGQAIGRGQFALVRTARFVEGGKKISNNDDNNGNNDDADDDRNSNSKSNNDNKPKVRATMAAKIISKSKINDVHDLERIKNELSVLRQITHPNLLRLVDVVHTVDKFYIISNRGGDDLFEYLSRQHAPVSDEKAKIIMQQVFSAVLELHNNGICHRDLKPENILLDVEDKIIVCDYGLCKRTTSQDGLTDFCGSPGFFAPEMITAKTYNGFKADVWSLGCILLELVVGHENFAQLWMSVYDVNVLSDADVFVEKIVDSRNKLFEILETTEDCEHISTGCKDLLKQLLNFDPMKRPEVMNAYTCKWVGGKFLSPSKRFSTDDQFDDSLTSISPLSATSSNGSPNGRRRSPLSFGASTTPTSQDMNQLSLNNNNGLRGRRQISIEVDTKPGDKQNGNASPATVKNRANQLLHLPPIDAPDTPKIRSAKKILNRGDQLMENAKGFEKKKSGNNNDGKGMK